MSNLITFDTACTVRLSLLTMTNPNQLCELLLFVVLRWLMRPILALNCILKIEQERSEKESRIGDALALAFRCACFCSALLIRFASYSPALLLMRPRHLVRSCAICSHNDVEVFKGGFEGDLVSSSSDHYGSVFQLVVLHREFSLANVHQAFW